MLITGTFGIGKSAVVKSTGEDIAKERGREYCYLNNMSNEDKEKLITENRIKDYFSVMDMRLSEFDATDIRGLPDFDRLRRWVEWKYPFFVEILSHPDSDGILFFDEFNLATDLTLKACYKILHDKIINDTKINYNWLIIGAGNTDEDRSNTTEIAPPIRDRCAEMILIPPTPKEWIKWATKYGLSPKIIAYLSWKGTSLRKVDLDKANKYTTERGWERINCFMSCPIDEIDLIAGTCIGEDIASEFLGFLRIEGEINLDDIIKSPEKLRGLTDAGKKYFVVSGLAEKYKENLMSFEQLFAVSTILEEIKSAEFVALLWRLSSRMNKTKFRKDFTTKELKHPLRAKFLKYLTDE